MNKLERFVAIGILVVGAMAFIGYALGSSSVPSDSEVTRARDQARAESEQAAAERAFEESRERAYERGLAKGRRKAEEEGVAVQATDDPQATDDAPEQPADSGSCPEGLVPLAAGGCGPPAPSESDGQ